GGSTGHRHCRQRQAGRADLVELNPQFDIDSHGAKTAARLAWSITRGGSTGHRHCRQRQAGRADLVELNPQFDIDSHG
ncbi:hypothetical protein, partial [Aquitalea pelogenes]|uniref:hypothetical protein n=1 Tax=Aquitalea pelogenes TaxID=1293573 RepID=UPI001EFBC8C5